jgi:hypothetical protein
VPKKPSKPWVVSNEVKPCWGAGPGGWPILQIWSLLTVFMGRVPHPFAFCAKGWAARTSIFNPKTWTYRSEVPTLADKTRKDGAPSVDALQARSIDGWATRPKVLYTSGWDCASTLVIHHDDAFRGFEVTVLSVTLNAAGIVPSANSRFPPPNVIGNIFSPNASTKSCSMSVSTRFALP